MAASNPIMVGRASPREDLQLVLTAVSLLPIALKTDFVGLGSLLRDFGPLHREQPIHLAFGPPLSVTGTGKAAHREGDTIQPNCQEKCEEQNRKTVR
jgi:hypothetical protein